MKKFAPLPRIITALMTGLIGSLAACGPAENDPGPGGVTVGEARALDEAAEMLDQRNVPLESEAAAQDSDQ